MGLAVKYHGRRCSGRLRGGFPQGFPGRRFFQTRFFRPCVLEHVRLAESCKPVDSAIGKSADVCEISDMELAEVTCPTCFEVFEVAVPHPDEMPTEVDYDCEICCRPMLIIFTQDEVYAQGLAD